MMQIKLSTKSFGRDAAEVASQDIANVSQTLVDVDISDVIAGRPEAEALDALRIMSNALSRLQLRYACILAGTPSGCDYMLSTAACMETKLAAINRDSLDVFGMWPCCLYQYPDV